MEPAFGVARMLRVLSSPTFLARYSCMDGSRPMYTWSRIESEAAATEGVRDRSVWCGGVPAASRRLVLTPGVVAGVCVVAVVVVVVVASSVVSASSSSSSGTPDSPRRARNPCPPMDASVFDSPLRPDGDGGHGSRVGNTTSAPPMMS